MQEVDLKRREQLPERVVIDVEMLREVGLDDVGLLL